MVLIGAEGKGEGQGGSVGGGRGGGKSKPVGIGYVTIFIHVILKNNKSGKSFFCLCLHKG